MSVPRGGRLDAVLNAFRVALLTQDAAAQRILASGIEDVLVSLGDIGDALQAEIDALGPDVQPWQIERLDRLRALEEQALRELDDYGQTLNSLLPVAQTNAVAAGAAAASASVQAVAGQAVVASSFRTLSAPALREIIAATSTGPLRDLLDTFGATGSAVLRQTLLDGIGQGRNARVVGDAIQRAVGVSRQRAQVIARTEILRAGKQANLASFAANANLISGWEWHAFKGPRTCSACLIMDGTEFPTSVTFFPGHPQCRCVGKPILRDYPQPKGQTGRDYLESLPEADQRRLLGNGKYDAWRSGELELDDMVAPRYSDQWGTSYQEASLATSQANAAVRRAGGVAGTPVPTPTPAPASVAPTPRLQSSAVQRSASSPDWVGQYEYPTPDADLTPEMLDARYRIAAGEDPAQFTDVVRADAYRRSGFDDVPARRSKELTNEIQQIEDDVAEAIKKWQDYDSYCAKNKSLKKCSYEAQEKASDKFFRSKDKMRARQDALIAERNSLVLSQEPPTADVMLATIRDVRPDYGQSTRALSLTGDMTIPDAVSIDGMVELFQGNRQYFPIKTWDQIADFTTAKNVRTAKVKRGYADKTRGIITISNDTGVAQNHVSLHELWHFAEYVNPNIRESEMRFLTSRILPNEIPTEIYANSGEFGIKDNFYNHYCGKGYGDNILQWRDYLNQVQTLDDNAYNALPPNEVGTMAFQQIFRIGKVSEGRNDIRFWNDRDYVNFMLRLLLSL